MGQQQEGGGYWLQWQQSRPHAELLMQPWQHVLDNHLQSKRSRKEDLCAKHTVLLLQRRSAVQEMLS